MEKLNKVWIGVYIIRAYLPRFQRVEARKRGVWSRLGEQARTRDGHHVLPSNGRRTGDNFYLSMLTGKNAPTPKEAKVTKGSDNGNGMDHILSFQSSEEGIGWIRGAFIGELKKEFPWREYGEEIQKESGSSLKISHVGDKMVLLQSGSEVGTEEVLKGLDEWSRFWFDRWKPWGKSDVNQTREVWTRWLGVPLHMWSARFFEFTCSRFGKMVEVHEITKSKLRIDEAFVQISTGLDSCDRTLPCKIDGLCFNVRIKEICCVEDLVVPEQVGESDLESDGRSSDDEEWSGRFLVNGMMEGWSEPEDGDGEEDSVHARNAGE